MYFMVAPLSAGTAVVPLTRDVGATGPPRTSAARPASAPLPGAGQQPLAQGLVGGGVDRGPGHGQRAVDHRLVGGRGGALGGELGLVVDRREGVDADGGVDRGQGQGHVAHVGRPGAPVAPVGEAAPQGLGVALVQGGQLVVVAHLGVGRAVGGQLQGRPGGQGAGLEAAGHLGLDVLQLLQVLGPDHPLALGVGRDDVGGVAAFSYGEGWTIMAACAPSKAPRSSSRILPPPPSSAGVPSTVTRSPASSATRARASPAPAAMAAITLCPQAWPTPGRASYSAHTTMCSGPDPARAANAVGRSPTPRSTSSPPPSSSSHSQAQARSSSNPSSGLAWIPWLRATSSSPARSTRSRAASLTSATCRPPPV